MQRVETWKSKIWKKSTLCLSNTKLLKLTYFCWPYLGKISSIFLIVWYLWLPHYVLSYLWVLYRYTRVAVSVLQLYCMDKYERTILVCGYEGQEYSTLVITECGKTLAGACTFSDHSGAWNTSIPILAYERLIFHNGSPSIHTLQWWRHNSDCLQRLRFQQIWRPPRCGNFGW